MAVVVHVTISYYQSGSSFMRQVGPNSTAAKPFGLTAIATNVGPKQLST